jgi:mono/diheme cytochrome c family protein
MKSILTLLLLISMLSACERSGQAKGTGNPLHLPPPGFVGNDQKGAALYMQYCLQCHGTLGSGTTQGPPLVHKTYEPSHHADLAFHMAVNTGVRSHHWRFGDMPAIPTLTPEDVAHIIRFIRIQQRNKGIQ